MMASHQDTTPDSTRTTNSSSLSSAPKSEDASDTFGLRMIRYEKDHRRMRDATTGAGVRVFGKARPQLGLSLTMENLERKNISVIQNGRRSISLDSSFDENIPIARKHPTLSDSDNSGPLDVNIPQQWGRKGRQKNDFLRRLSTTSPPNNPNPNRLQDPDEIWQRRTILTGDSPRSDVGWTASPSENGGSVGDQGSPLRKVLTYGESGQVRRRYSSSERRLQRKEESATAAPSDDRVRGAERDTGNGARFQDGLESAAEGQSTSSDRRGGRIPRLRQSFSRTIRNADGAAIGTTKAILEGGQESNRRNENADTLLVAVKVTKDEGSEDKNHARKHKHHDIGSRDLLRQLAASSTPSPLLDISRTSKLPTKRSTNLSHNHLPSSTDEARTSETAETEALAGRPETESYLPMINGLDHTPLPDDVPFARNAIPSETPVVTGAWVATPATRNIGDNQQRPSTPPTVPANDPNIAIEPEITEAAHDPLPSFPRVPFNPLSAASALLLRPEENHFGDSTIVTLRDLVSQIDDVTTALDDSTVDLIEHVTDPVHVAQRERKEEDDILSRMDERLRAARMGLRDASRGLRKVEREVEEVSTALEESEIREHENGKMLVSRHQAHGLNAHGLCDVCEGVTLSGLVGKAWRNFLRNFYAWDRKGRWRWIPRLTWLGLFYVMFLLWSVTELTLCDIYCHKLSGPYMVGWGVNIYAPRMPYVTTTVLIKWPLEDWIWPVMLFIHKAILGEGNLPSPSAGSAGLGKSTGYTYGYAGPGAFETGFGTAGGSTATTIIASSFGDDEVL